MKTPQKGLLPGPLILLFCKYVTYYLENIIRINTNYIHLFTVYIVLAVFTDSI